MSELPRLSGVLRLQLRGVQTDLQKETLRLERNVKNLRKQQTFEEFGEGSMTWSSFVYGIEEHDEDVLKKMRATYNLFLAELKDLVGDDTSSEELHEIAHTVFQLFIDPEKSFQGKMNTLAKICRETPPKKTSEALSSHVMELHEWKTSLLQESVEEVELKKAVANQNVPVFGNDILFRFAPPDYLSKEPKKVSNTIEVVRSDSSSTSKVKKSQPKKEAKTEIVFPKGNWLEEECKKFAKGTNPADLFRSIVSVAQSSASAEALQGQLFDLLGAEGLELMGLIVERFSEVKKMSLEDTNLVAGSLPASSPPNTAEHSRYLPMTGGMSVMLERDKKGQQRRRKQDKKNFQQQQQQEAHQEQQKEQSKIEKYAEALHSKDRETLPHVGRDQYIAGGIARATEAKFHMPEGAKRVDVQDFESVWLPPKYPPYRSDDSLVPVTEFEEWARPAFKGYPTLNRIQSSVFNSAYYSNENLLICAPTGAGKTNIAMLTILREIGRNMDESGRLDKDNFKICYVAPMKALAAEMTANFGTRLSYLGIAVRELTGDMQLTKQEIEETQIIVTTPEKWDVITRKSTDSPLTQKVHLLILDEVHLLNEDRGPVIETLVARTLRQVESTQIMIRIVGLSATLPNYKDVAHFMRVNEKTGLHYFDGTYRPVPLEQTFVGVKPKQFQKQREVMTRYCFDTIVKTLKKGKQCMVFVHSRKDTTRTAQDLLEIAVDQGLEELFSEEVIRGKSSEWARREISKSRNQDVKRLFLAGFACHHAGMLRSDRNLVEKMFHEGLIKVLCCTSTLAWGVNLPCKQVIIKGTQVYNAEKGKFCSLGMLDVMQIFGRAGRPQFDDEGSAVMITTHDELYRYLALTSHQAPIESQFIENLADNLNAEIVLGTVTNIQEAVSWLSYTYLFVRMLRNPMVYGIGYEEKELDPNLVQKRTELIIAAANELDDVRMIRFNNPYFSSTNMGQTASHFYIHHDTIRIFNETFDKNANALTEAEVFRLICNATEFENINVREEEIPELDKLKKLCPIEIKGDVAGDKVVKSNVLLQTYISRTQINTFALVCDTNFVAQNAARIVRGLFEISLRKGLPDTSSLLLKICKMIDLRIWDFQHPLRQFDNLKDTLIAKLEQRSLTVDKLLEMEASEISAITRVPAATSGILYCVSQIPYLQIDATVQPITRSIIRIKVTLTPDFRWNDRVHGQMQPFWIWVENPEEVGILHHEYFLLRKKENKQPSEIIFTTPISHPIPPQYILHVCSDRWLGSDNSAPLSFKHLILPQLYPPHTQLLDLQPLPITVLHNKDFEKIFKYGYFNPIQTQIFHTIFHTDQNVLLGAPTGSGKTVAAELAVLRVMKETPHLKAVYLGPLKALVQERLKDWDKKFVQMLGKKMVELTGEFTPDILALKEADIICTTPEKWDGISRSWQNRGYVKQVGLIIIDEIHLLGEDRGPILEVIVSRMRYIASQTETPVRVVGLSTALANAKDLAEWLGIDGPGLFNFHPSVRPVPLKIHVQGYEGKAYCPRMAKMNRPSYAAILSYSPHKPVLIFVSSRRQTRLTAIDIISHVAADGNPKRFVMKDEEALRKAIAKVKDPNLKHTLSFGIGLHHAGLPRDDRASVEELFGTGVIQVLISTSTLAWGVNLPAHLVIVKGGEYFDAKSRRYVDYAITDMLQMMGRAGRPQYDDSGEAVIMCTTAMKGFYKKFLYEPFPVESSLADVLHDHLNAEIVSGTISTKHDAVDYLTWTYLFRRILVNPTYYGLESSDLETVNKYLSRLVDDTLLDLEAAHCIEIDDDQTTLYPLTMGQIISYYYLHHMTAKLFYDEIDESATLSRILQILCSATEYDELPVRHNEDGLNEDLAKDEGIRWEPQSKDWENPGVKANLLLQAHFSRVLLPISDYVTDQKSVLDQAIRILQAMVDVSADGGWLFTTLKCMELMQMVVQAQWLDQSSFFQLPFFDTPQQHALMVEQNMEYLPQLLRASQEKQRKVLTRVFENKKTVDSVLNALSKFPVMEMNHELSVEKDSVIRAGDEVILTVNLRKKPNNGNGAYCPMFPKYKREGWWLVCGNPETGELLALKRVNISRKGWQSVKIDLDLFADDEEDDEDEDELYEVQEKKEKVIVDRELWVYLVSDSYIGLDMMQKFSIKLEITQ